MKYFSLLPWPPPPPPSQKWKSVLLLASFYDGKHKHEANFFLKKWNSDHEIAYPPPLVKNISLNWLQGIVETVPNKVVRSSVCDCVWMWCVSSTWWGSVCVWGGGGCVCCVWLARVSLCATVEQQPQAYTGPSSLPHRVRPCFTMAQVVRSPYSVVNIPANVSLSRFVLDKAAVYGTKTALVSRPYDGFKVLLL